MSGQKTKTSKLLLILSLLACPGIGLLITQTSHIPSSIRPSDISVPLWKGFGNSSDKPASTGVQDPSTVLDPGLAITSAPVTQAAASATEPPVSVSATEQPSDVPAEPDVIIEEPAPAASDSSSVSGPYVKFRPASSDTVSPEAASGTWTKSGSDWYFMVNSQAYHGWLYDTDKRIYYLDPATGAMLKDWQSIDGKQYYFNQDGVLQTGRLLIDGILYEFDEAGVLISSGPAPAPKTDTAE